MHRLKVIPSTGAAPHKLRQLAEIVAAAVPMTARGVLVTFFAGISLWRFGFGTLDLLLFVIGISGLVLVVLSSLTIGGAAMYLYRRTVHGTLESGRLEAGSPIRTGFSMPALSRVPLVKLHWRWKNPRGVECRILPRDRRLVEEVVATRRCQVAAIRRRFTVEDAFGLARIAWEGEDPTPLTILPDVGRLRRMPVMHSLAAAEGMHHPAGAPEGDRMEIRRYVPGDSARHILWKTYARTRQLNVRVPERSIEIARKTVAYLLTGPDDEAAAAAARVALETGVFGFHWLFGADGTEQPADSLEPALQAIARSGSIGNGSNGSRSHPAGGLSSFLRNPEVRNEVHCIVFAPCRSGPWTEEALLAARNFSGAVSFVLGTDGLVRHQTPPLWRRLLFAADEVDGTTTEELNDLLRTVAATGCPALVVDRRSGRTWGADRQRAEWIPG